jgi:hypothetical protein
MDDADTRMRISPSLFALKEVRNLPRDPIDSLKSKIQKRFQELLAVDPPGDKTESESG